MLSIKDEVLACQICKIDRYSIILFLDTHCLCVTSLRPLATISSSLLFGSNTANASHSGCVAFKIILMSVPARLVRDEVSRKLEYNILYTAMFDICKFLRVNLQYAHGKVVITLSVSYLPQMCPWPENCSQNKVTWRTRDTYFLKECLVS